MNSTGSKFVTGIIFVIIRTTKGFTLTTIDSLEKW